ncbi:MAG: leucine-rich repeat domain-containing protein [Candidatus Cloacimonetes bacterium]|nr:leucine-rich repeat domain-containing protein [Candidatus Cloacimonadota bacterium]
MNKKLLLIVVIGIMGLSLFAQIVPDDNFRDAINAHLGQPVDYEPTIADLNSLTGTLDAGGSSILSIEGAQYLTNITGLHLENNQISAISAISDLTNLTNLYLYNNQISNITVLSDLSNLTELILISNQISDISAISGLTNLTKLHLSNNEINNISVLSSLTNLTHLGMYSNQISDISIVSVLMNLTSLQLGFNYICNISSLTSLTNLTGLELNNNQISDISVISGLTNLTSLGVHGNQITDIYPLVENAGLGSGDVLFLEEYGLTNPLSLEAIEVHIPILQSRGFAYLGYPYEANLNTACYPHPNRHADGVGYGSELSWYGAESGTVYEVYLGISMENLISIGEGQYIEDNTFTISPELLPNTEYWWRVKSTTDEEVLWSGMWHFTTGNSVAINNEIVEIPQETILQSAYPNPFNPTTTIKFSVKENETAILEIFNLKGQLVKSYPVFSAGNHLAEWNGKDNSGNKVSSGIYLYKLQSESTEQVHKMLMLK